MNKVLLSIITVVRNDARRLATTMDSLKKLYGDHRFEHIVVDGKSTDQLTLDLILNAKRYSNYVYISEADKGVYDAMNKGVNLATGHFLLFLNCGDRIVASPGQIDNWLTGLNEASGVVIGCFCCHLNFGDHSALLLPKSGVRHKLPTSHQAMVFSRTFMLANPYDIQYLLAADFDLYLSAKFEQILIARVIEPLTNVEVVGLSSENPIQTYKEYLQIAYKKLHGRIRWIVLVRISFKAIAVITLKQIFPRKWVFYLRHIV